MEVELVEDAEFELLDSICRTIEEQRPSVPKRLLPASFTAPEPPTLPFLTFNGEVRYCFESGTIERAAQYLLAVQPAAIGFDIEWVVTYQTGVTPRPVSLIQLAFRDTLRYIGGTPAYTCLLLQVSAGGLSPALRQLLADPSIQKVGIGISNDSIKLEKDHGVVMHGVVDLSGYANARLCGGASNLQPQKWSLAALTERLLRHRLRKAQNLRCSNWENVPLSNEQRQYAAVDAWASLAVYENLFKLPVIWSPEATTLAAAMCTDAGSGADDTIIDDVIVPACSLLGKLQPAKLAVHKEHMSGCRIEQIAAARQIRVDTVQSYLAEAIIAGFPYRMSFLGLSTAALETVASVASGLLGIELSLVVPGGAASEQSLPPWDLVEVLLKRVDGSIRKLHDDIFVGELGFGEIRVALAHLGRCNVVS